jgi:hypothetical protein
LYKRNNTEVHQKCLIQGLNAIIGNVEILHVAIKPEKRIKIVPATRPFVLSLSKGL